jgi:hypothetical protein
MYKLFNNNTIKCQEWWDFIATQDKDEVKDVVLKMTDIKERLKSFTNGHYYKTKIRNYCNFAGYSDWHPYEVVRVISANCVEVRAMDTKQIVFPQEVYVGGFSAHTADNWNQDYEYTSNPSNPIVRLRKGKKGWNNGRFHMSDKPFKHYDYNF